MDGNVSVSANLSPNKSQVLLLAFLLSGICSYIVGFYFLWFEKQVGYLSVTIGTLMMLLTFYAWFKSQKDTDLVSSATILEDSHAGFKLTTDSRLANSPEGVDAICKFLETASLRKPLPSADGVIDSNGQPIPSSQEKAECIVNEANQIAQSLVDQMLHSFKSDSSEVNRGSLVKEPSKGVKIQSDAIANNIKIQ